MFKDIQRGLLLTQAFLTVILMAACSTNPATGEQQFTALMSPQQENKVGASEHENIVKQFGLYNDPALQNYLNQIGSRLAKGTERPDVVYKFYVVDSPIVNAFALPGGYVYVSRGLLALANNEAELAGVVGHEIGHITARHSAERYSTGVVTSLGAAVLAAAVDSSGVSQALGLGSNLFLSSYSRSQENQADTLGIRYLARSGYDTQAMSSFLAALQNESALEDKIAGQQSGEMSYFSTHPATADRVSKTLAEARQYPQSNAALGHDAYLSAIDGLTYGDSAAQGLVRGHSFYHPAMGFAFDAPDDFRLINQPSQVIGTSKSGAVLVFDMVRGASDPYAYLTQSWMKDKELSGAERITVNGMSGATAAFTGKINNKPVTIRLVTIAWQDRIVRFQMAIPQNAAPAVVEGLKRASYSFRSMSAEEKQRIRPYRIDIVTAKAGDSVASLAAAQAIDAHKEEYFRLLNRLNPGQNIVAGQRYKVIRD